MYNSGGLHSESLAQTRSATPATCPFKGSSVGVRDELNATMYKHDPQIQRKYQDTDPGLHGRRHQSQRRTHAFRYA